MSTEFELLERKFNKYIFKIKKIDDVSNEDKLYLYANYKQALEGNNSREKPSIFDRISMEKWKAWSSVKDQSKEDCMRNYIKKVKSLYKEII